MIVFAVAAFSLTVGVLIALVAPLLRRPGIEVPGGDAPAERSAFALATYAQQLAEIDRDVERGVIAQTEADGLRLEIKRRMLAAADDADTRRAHDPAVSTPAAAGVARRWPALAIIVAVPAAAFGLYLTLGLPHAPDQPLAARQTMAQRAQTAPPATAPRPGEDDAAQEAAFREALARLEQRLAANPDDVRGWIMLGRGHRALGDHAAAARAFAEAYRRGGGPASLAAEYGEALIAAGNGRVDGEALRLMEEAHAADPMNVSARFFLALSAAQAGDLKSAVQGWVDMLALSPADAPWRGMVEEQVARATALLGDEAKAIRPSAAALALKQQAAERTTAPAELPGPAAADIEAARQMSPDERAQVVRGMVERLAARLEANPGDRDGWLRLARAYDVLGEADKAKEARARAAALTGG